MMIICTILTVGDNEVKAWSMGRKANYSHSFVLFPSPFYSDVMTGIVVMLFDSSTRRGKTDKHTDIDKHWKHNALETVLTFN